MKDQNKRRTFDRQFTLDAVALVETGDRSTAPIARDLGTDPNLLHVWIGKLGSKKNVASGFRGAHSRLEAALQGEKRARLIAEEEREILKNALAVFSRRPQ